ncbi:hypothetical protein Syun_020489 [Stephania yunnanensis]|uniref:Cysteine-rich receptor-like protein kinase 2 n=1 Tax=Stephania yunnanensis TaxID=152371 RepID=A0AAP0NN87_9MAGN
MTWHNFIRTMGNLSSMADDHGHGTTEVGEGPNSVYGLVQCFKDLSSIDCRLCFAEIRSVLPKCYPNIGGRIFLDGCFGRYENYSFFDQAMDSKDSNVCSSGRKSSNPDKFNEVLKMVISNVSVEAQRSGGFAVGSGSSSLVTVFALAQCWQDLDKRLCNACLQNAASSIMSCSPGVEGRSLKAGCYMRYSTRVFWNLNQTAVHSSGKSNSLWIIICSALGGFLLIVAVVIWIVKAYMRRTYCDSLQDLFGSGLSAAISQSNLNFKYNDLKRATKRFDASNKVGQGSCGAVFKGILHDGREVAVKRLVLNTRQWIDQFFNEVDLINRVRHKNLVKLLGCSADGPESLLVYEYYANKSLDLFIFDVNKAKLLDWQRRLEIIHGVAEGLSYLHEESEIRIIHRDIKASNVLLDDKFKPKITDFGLARSIAEDQTHLSTGIAGTLGYMAPEYIVHGHLTEKADVYSFGMLTLEIVTGQRCSSVGTQPGQFFLSKIWSHYKAGTVDQIIDRSCYREESKDEILHVVNVALLCTQATAGYRPSMSKVVELLRSSKTKEDLYQPSDPPFLDVLPMEGNSCLLPPEATQRFSESSEWSIAGR